MIEGVGSAGIVTGGVGVTIGGSVGVAIGGGEGVGNN